jgi:hypothetical protein
VPRRFTRLRHALDVRLVRAVERGTDAVVVVSSVPEDGAGARAGGVASVPSPRETDPSTGRHH